MIVVNQIYGVSVIERIIFKEFFDEIIIATNSHLDFKKYEKDCLIISDVIKDIGPLGGLYSALLNTSKETQSMFVIGI